MKVTKVTKKATQVERGVQQSYTEEGDCLRTLTTTGAASGFFPNVPVLA